MSNTKNLMTGKIIKKNTKEGEMHKMDHKHEDFNT